MTSLYVITEHMERQKVCVCEENVYSFITSQNTQQCQVLGKTTSSENITKYHKQNQLKIHINLQNPKLASI